MKFVVDMNLTPKWVKSLRAAGHDAIHWSIVGTENAPDHDIAHWALSNKMVVLTSDLDFGTLLAASGAAGPSVIQLRCQRLNPKEIGEALLKVVAASECDLAKGAFMTFDGQRARLRGLPI